MVDSVRLKVESLYWRDVDIVRACDELHPGGTKCGPAAQDAGAGKRRHSRNFLLWSAAGAL
jgi:hypothetical protein